MKATWRSSGNAAMLEWLAANGQGVILILLFSAFLGVLYVVYGSRKRSDAIESEKYVIFDENDDDSTSLKEGKGRNGE